MELHVFIITALKLMYQNRIRLLRIICLFCKNVSSKEKKTILFCFFFLSQAEKSMADDEEEKVGVIAEEVSKKQKGNKNGEAAFFTSINSFARYFPSFQQIVRKIW